jgi:hypothetical protein
VHRARRHLIMVRHQPHITAVIATEFDHIIGKALAAGEMLFFTSRNSSPSDDGGHQ